MNKDEETQVSLENEKINDKIFDIIKGEYIRNMFKILTFFGIIMTIFIISVTMADLLINNSILYYTFIYGWTCLILLLAGYLFGLSINILSPKLTSYLDSELNSLELRIERKFKLNISSLLSIILSCGLYLLNNYLKLFSVNGLNALIFIRILIVFLLLIITVPILRGKLHDKFTVKLSSKYEIRLDIELKMIKHVELDSHIVKIYMSSNRLNIKQGTPKAIFRDIIERRWLPPNKIRKNLSQNYLIFSEFSTLINFRSRFINLISALREWDSIVYQQN